MSVLVKIINESPYPLPQYATDGAAGMDVRAHLEAPVSLRPMERVLVPTGIRLEVPAGYELQVRPRSGLAIRQGITLLNTPGTIDSDYRGELKVILVNLSEETQIIQPGDRIAQLVLARYETICWEPAETLQATRRGEGGFGHTGTR